MKQLGLAFQLFHDSQKHFPSAYESIPGPGFDPPHPVTRDRGPGWAWGAQLMPYYEEESLYDTFNRQLPCWHTVFHGEHHPILSSKTWVGVVPGATVCPSEAFAFSACDYAATLVLAHSGPSSAELHVIHPPNSPMCQVCQMYSEHQGGCNVLMGDGSVRFIDEMIFQPLRTALSARNPKWLDENDAVIEKRHKEGQMGDDEYATFKKIVERARSGEWQEAERNYMAFQRAQRPTPEQIERVRRREI
jgi:prepilin-type processing-associated H-X9-DG protein